MSNYIVGLDFGTHQSKVCIENSSNRLQVTYEFLEFPGIPNGAQKVLLPSVVQINNDGTVSYGFVNPANAMVIANDGTPPPQKPIVKEPETLLYPPEPHYEANPPKPEPKHKGPFAILAKLLLESEEIKRWKQLCASTERANESKRIDWEFHKKEIDDKNNKARQEYERHVAEVNEQYQEAYEAWREDPQRCTQMRFRYFKQATFFDRSIWTNDFISPEDASIWYLAYIRFLLNEKLGKDYIVRMGVPCSYQDIDSFRQHAYNLWAGAGRLVEHYQNLAAFLSAKYKDMREYCQYKKVLLKDEDPFSVRTEAQASLFAVVSNKRLDTRINLLFDIGGGTTDIAVFYITPQPEQSLKIMDKISVPLGLNHIYEEYQHTHPHMALEQIHVLFANQEQKGFVHGEFKEYIREYLTEINEIANSLSLSIMSALQRNLGLSRSPIIKALQNNPCVFCGGGSIYNDMRDVYVKLPGITGVRGDFIRVFCDSRVVDKNLLEIRNLQNKHISSDIFQILSAAYGLSLTDNWMEIPSEDITGTFRPGANVAPIQRTNIPERNDEAIK